MTSLAPAAVTPSAPLAPPEDRDHGSFRSALERALGRALAGAAPRARALALAPEAKRVRPLLLKELAGALGVDPDDDATVRAALAVELIHTASLIHDDVIDVAATRRGLPSVNAELGNAAAVLVGDEVLCRALEAAGSMQRGAMIAPCVAAVGAMTRGALREIEANGELTLDDDGWRAIAADKTGALFGLCGTLAALLAGDHGRIERFREGARLLGVAFQAADDVADLVDGSDLAEKNPNLAVLCAARDDPALRARVLAAWARPRLADAGREQLARAVLASPGVPRALAVAEAALVQARAAFGGDVTRPGVLRALGAGEGHLAHARRTR